VTASRERLAVLVDAAAFDCDAWPATLHDEARRMEAVSAAFEMADAILAAGFGSMADAWYEGYVTGFNDPMHTEYKNPYTQ